MKVISFFIRCLPDLDRRRGFLSSIPGKLHVLLIGHTERCSFVYSLPDLLLNIGYGEPILSFKFVTLGPHRLAASLQAVDSVEDLSVDDAVVVLPE